jgi:hypothetical protein
MFWRSRSSDGPIDGVRPNRTTQASVIVRVPLIKRFSKWRLSAETPDRFVQHQNSADGAERPANIDCERLESAFGASASPECCISGPAGSSEEMREE